MLRWSVFCACIMAIFYIFSIGWLPAGLAGLSRWWDLVGVFLWVPLAVWVGTRGSCRVSDTALLIGLLGIIAGLVGLFWKGLAASALLGAGVALALLVVWAFVVYVACSWRFFWFLFGRWLSGK